MYLADVIGIFITRRKPCRNYVTAGLVTSFSGAGGRRMYIIDCESVVDLLAVSRRALILIII